MFHGVTRIWWELADTFGDPLPYTFQLQASYTGTDNALDWVDVGSAAVNPTYLDDDTSREQAGKTLRTHYRLVLTTSRHRYVSGPESIWGLLESKDWNLAREIVRKESLRLKQAGSHGYLIRKMRYGVKSEDNTDFLTDEVKDSGYLATWGTAFKIGYHPPVPVMADMTGEFIAEKRGGDNIAQYSSRPGTVRARFVGFPALSKEDVWVDARNDQRWSIDEVQVTAKLRGVPLVVEATINLIPYNDVVYKIPVTGLSYAPETGEGGEDYQPTDGTGCVRVDHDYCEEGAYIYQGSDCCPIEGATILAFTQEDWDANNRTPDYAVATSYTDANGMWTTSMLLDPGTYVLQFEKTGEYGPDTVTVEVAENCVSESSSSQVSASSSCYSSSGMSETLTLNEDIVTPWGSAALLATDDESKVFIDDQYEYQESIFGTTNPTETYDDDSITQVDVSIEAEATTSDYDVRVRVYVGGEWSNPVAVVNFDSADDEKTEVITFNGTWSTADFTDFRIGVELVAGHRSAEMLIDYINAEITGTQTVCEEVGGGGGAPLKKRSNRGRRRREARQEQGEERKDRRGKRRGKRRGRKKDDSGTEFNFDDDFGGF